MPTIFRISQPGREPITDVDRVEAVEGAIRAGRYDVDQISAEPLPSGHTSRRWGTAIKRPDGAVTLEPRPMAGPMTPRFFVNVGPAERPVRYRDVPCAMAFPLQPDKKQR
jgi:hypothetical protein